MIRTATLFLFMVLFLTACVNPMKLLEADKPERAYEVSKKQIDRRLYRDKPLRENELLALRESYRWLQDLQIVFGSYISIRPWTLDTPGHLGQQLLLISTACGIALITSITRGKICKRYILE